jgi:hypothetical protein
MAMRAAADASVVFEWVPKLGAASGLDPELLRQALERELLVPVATVDSVPNDRAHLRIEADRLEAVHVVFARADGALVERVVDVSSMRPQAVDALGLLAANLVRDEAAELLAAWQASSPLQSSASDERPAPAAVEAVAVAAAPVTPVMPAVRTPREPGGCDRRSHLRSVSFGADLLPRVGRRARSRRRLSALCRSICSAE